MRENESDGAGGWWQSPGHGSQGGPRDENRDEGAGTRWPAPDVTPAPGSDYPDTIAFGSPSGSSADPGYRQAGFEQAWYGNQGGGHGNQAAVTGTRTVTETRGPAEARPAGRCPIPRRGVPALAGGCWSTWPSPRSRRASAPGRP